MLYKRLLTTGILHRKIPRETMNPSPKTLFKHPHLISRVGRGENASKQLKLQIKKLQELYRYARDCEEHCGATTLDLLLSVFKKYHTHIKYVDYLEKNVIYLPANYYPRWVKIPVNPFLHKIESAIKTHTRIPAVYTMISAIIWRRFTTSPIMPSSLVRKSAKLEMRRRTWLEWANEMGIKYHYHTRKGLEHPMHQLILDKNNIELGKKDKPSKVKKQRIQSKLIHSQQLEDQFLYHNTYYPQSSYAFYDPNFPMIFYSDDEEYVSIPLVNGIAPVLLLGLAGHDAILQWFKESGKKYANELIRTIERDVTKSFEYYLSHSKYIHPRKAFLKYGHPRQIHEYNIDLVEIMDKGIPINQDKLDSRPLTDDLDLFRKNINISLKQNDGWCKGSAILRNPGSRTYFRQFNITSFPTDFRDCVEHPDGRTLWYFDIAANDISILFNLSNDINGLACLSSGKSPYLDIVDRAKQMKLTITEKQVKAFINPWLYGAINKTIVKDNKGLLDLGMIKKLKNILEKSYPEAINWKKSIINSVSKNQIIPNTLNPFKDGDIPMPKKLARRYVCSFLIQRMGSVFMRGVINHLANDSNPVFDVSGAYVHDSLLLIPKRDVDFATYDSAIAEALRMGLQKTQLQVLTARTGSGSTWADAEAGSKSNPLFVIN